MKVWQISGKERVMWMFTVNVNIGMGRYDHWSSNLLDSPGDSSGTADYDNNGCPMSVVLVCDRLQWKRIFKEGADFCMNSSIVKYNDDCGVTCIWRQTIGVWYFLGTFQKSSIILRAYLPTEDFGSWGGLYLSFSHSAMMHCTPTPGCQAGDYTIWC